MTNEKMLTLLNSFLNDNNYVTMAELKAGLEENIRESVNKNSGKPSLAKAMNSVIKAAKKDGVRPSLMGGFMNDDWLTVFDGYRAIQTKEAIELEMIPANLDPLNVNNMIGSEAYTKMVKLPTIQELKTFIKIKKAEIKAAPSFIVKPPYMIVLETDYDEQIAFNPDYLLDLLEAIPSEYGYYNTNIGPMYLENDTTRGLVLPVRINR